MRVVCLILFIVVAVHGQTTESSEYPAEIRIDALESIFHPVIFAHGLHAEMSYMGSGCAVCHHFAEDDEFAPCVDCHEKDVGDLSMPALNGAYHRNCLSCHRDWAIEQVCESCHVKKLLKKWVDPAKHLDPTDFIGKDHPPIQTPSLLVFETPDLGGLVTFHHNEHVDLYQYKCEHCHREENCSKCHNYTPSPKPVVVHLPDEHDPCIQCHDTDDGDCEICHSDEISTGFTHSLTGWPLKAYHADGDCNACHPADVPVQAQDRTCNSCHSNFEVGEFDHAATGLVLNDDHIDFDCYECHENEKYDQAPYCSECHDDDVEFPADLPGVRK